MKHKIQIVSAALLLAFFLPVQTFAAEPISAPVPETAADAAAVQAQPADTSATEAAAPAETPAPAGVVTTLSDPNYFHPEFLNQQAVFTYQETQWTLPYSILKDTPITVTATENGRTCTINDTAAIDAFLQEINSALAAMPVQHADALFDNGAGSYIHRVRLSHYRLFESVRSWLLTLMQQNFAVNTPTGIVQELDSWFITPVSDGTTLSASPDFVLSGHCVTSYRTSDAGRSTNVELAARTLNELVVMPGQSVSVSRQFGPRTEANGYQSAGVYVNGKSVPGIGGGICQVSSTAYNALVNSGLTILERHPHSMTVPYLPIGLDAAIASGSKDLRFRNDYSAPVILRTSCVNKKLTVDVYVWNQDLQGRTFKIWSKQTGELSADSYLTTSVNGVETGTKFVATSRYIPHR